MDDWWSFWTSSKWFAQLCDMLTERACTLREKDGATLWYLSLIAEDRDLGELYRLETTACVKTNHNDGGFSMVSRGYTLVLEL